MFDVTITIPDMDQPTPEAAAQAARQFLATEVMLHDLVFSASSRRDDVEHVVALKGHAIELPRMLVLSTAHITKETDENFSMHTDDVPGNYHSLECGGPGGERYGWIMPIGPHIEWSHMVSADLVAIRRLAESVGATWIMLDRDGPTIDGLETWEW